MERVGKKTEIILLVSPPENKENIKNIEAFSIDFHLIIKLSSNFKY